MMENTNNQEEKELLNFEQIKNYITIMRSELTSAQRGLFILQNHSEKDKSDKIILSPLLDVIKNYISVKKSLIDSGQIILQNELDKKDDNLL